MKPKFDIDHTKKLPSGACAACVFLERAITLQKNPEYRAQYEAKLEEARRLHAAANVKQEVLL